MLKRTRQREVILRVLQKTHAHPSVVWIYDAVRKEIPNISLATVYRNLKLLLEQGQISELELNGNLSRFDVRTDLHEHLWCEKCNRIFDFDINPEVSKELESQITPKTGFRISSHFLVFHGICRECLPD